MRSYTFEQFTHQVDWLLTDATGFGTEDLFDLEVPWNLYHAAGLNPREAIAEADECGYFSDVAGWYTHK